MKKLDRRRTRKLLIREFRSVLMSLCEETAAERRRRHARGNYTKREKAIRDRHKAREEGRSATTRGSDAPAGSARAGRDEPGTRGHTPQCEDSPRQRYDELMKEFETQHSSITAERLGRVIHLLLVLREKGLPLGLTEVEKEAEYEKIKRYMRSSPKWEPAEGATEAQTKAAREKFTRDIRGHRVSARREAQARWPEDQPACRTAPVEVHVLPGDDNFEYAKISGDWHERDRDSDDEWTVVNAEATQRLEADARPKE